MSTTQIESVPPVNSYDEVQYPSLAHDVTHPDRLYTLAKLFHLDPTLPENARVLELGCASGGNLIPVAERIPTASFVGVDLSRKQIAEAQVVVEELGLTNISFRAEDFRHIDESFGQFDYIICQGVFSWVPHEAQQRIFEICRDRLSPNGIAFISYNTYPGWFMRGMIRQMMLHHVQNIPDPISKIKQARALLAFIVASTDGQDTPYAQILKQELENLTKVSDSYLFHEHLEENNHPVFFYEFMEKAKSFDLQFVGESNLASMVTENLPSKAAEALSKLTNDVYQRSQYTDFVTNRMFRQSLLCLKHHKINRHIDETSLAGAYFCGSFQQCEPEQGRDLTNKVEVTFKCPNGRGIKTNHSAIKALMYVLEDAWPTALQSPEICQRIETRIAEFRPIGDDERTSIANGTSSHLLQMLVRGDIELRYIPDRFAEAIGEHPKISPFARRQARTGNVITTQRHAALEPDPLTRLLIPFMDGTRTREQLAECINDLAREGKLMINIQGTPPSDMTPVYSAAVDKVLDQLRRAALLLAD